MSTRDGLSRIKTWYNDCFASHTECQPLKDQPFPTRLLSIDSDTVKLCQSIDIAQRPQYATLSHCWGTLRFQTLLNENLNVFQEIIPLEILPKTFLDAIEVARSIGFQYIWIDSLCIIQNNGKNWVKESALMCSVYNGSSLNIAASGAQDGNIGFFHKRSRLWRCHIPLTTARSANHHAEFFNSRFEHEIRDSILSKRGWVVQERILSHRTIHFTNRQIFWECNAHVCCEIFPGAVREDQALRDPYTKIRPTIETWDSVVQAYSRCDLTYDSDKLVAISGIAQLVSPNSKVAYVAGMWAQRFALHLCWFVKSERSATKYRQYVAPSWAWASINTSQVAQGIEAVNDYLFDNMATQEYVIIKEVDIKHAMEELFGAISSARLQISCELLSQATVCSNEPHYLWESIVRIGEKVVSCYINPDYADDFSGHFHEIFLMLIARINGRPTGLIIRPAGGKGRWERVGLFQSSLIKHEKQALMLAIQAGLSPIDEESCVDVIMEKGQKRYIIDLV